MKTPSAADLGIRPETLIALLADLAAAGVCLADVQEEAFCASGKGGRHGAHSRTAVRLRWGGVVAVGRRSRSRSENRFLALRALLDAARREAQ